MDSVVSVEEAIINELKYRLAVAEDALQHIATPERRDGTFNLDRRACQELAEKTLERMRGL